MTFLGRNPYHFNSDLEELMDLCFVHCHGPRGGDACPDLFAAMSPFFFLAPGVVVPQKNLRPSVWIESLDLPAVFSFEDVTLKVDDGVAHITASRTFGEETTGTNTVQATRKVKLPATVNHSTVKTLWRRNKLYLRGEWVKENSKEEVKTEQNHEAEKPLETETNDVISAATAEETNEEPEETNITEDSSGPVVKQTPESEVLDQTSDDEHDILSTDTPRPKENMEDEEYSFEMVSPSESQPESTEGLEVADMTDETVTAPGMEETVDEEEKKPLDLRLELPSINPDNISVKLVGDRLIIEGTQRETKNGHSWINQVRRVVNLPDYIDVEQIRSSVTDDGVLKIFAPVYQSKTQEKTITVKKENN